MDSASRRSWAPLTTVTLPEGDSLQQCFGDEREVDPERFLQVLCQKRGKKKFAFELSTEQALLFLRVYRTTADNAYARRVRQLLAQPDVAKVFDPNEPAFLELKVRLNQAPNLKEVDACERKLKDMRDLSPLDHEEAECLRQAIRQKRLKLRMLQLVHSNMPAVTDEALNLASVALRQNFHREAAQLIEKLILTALNRPGADDALDTFVRTLSCLVSSPPAEELWAEGEPFDLFWRGSSVSTDGTGFELFGFCGARHEDWGPKTLEKQGTHVVTPRALRGDEATAANLFGLAMLIEKDDAGLYATLAPERPYLLSVRESGHPTESEHANPPDWVVALGDDDPNELCLVDTRMADGELPLGRILPVKPKGRPTALWFIPGGMPIGTPTPANAVLMRLRDAAALDPNAAPFIDAAYLHPFVRWRDGCYRLYEEPAA